MSVCEYSPFGARMVRFSVNVVNHSVSKVFTLLTSSFCFSPDPGDLELVMMHKAYLEGEIDKLLQYPEYGQVLLMEPP